VSRAGIVLCGGRSSRMGRAKAWLPWFGMSMIEHVVATLLPVVDEVIVVTSDEIDLPPLRARVVRDREQSGGPLVGIREGLEAATAELAFVTSVDAPFLRSDFVEDLFGLGGAAAPLADGHVQVLSAVYPCAAWRVANDLLEQGIRRPLRLLERLDYKPIEYASPDDPPVWKGFNTPMEYLDAVRGREPTATAEIEFLGRAARNRDRVRERLAVGTLGELFARIPDSSAFVSDGRIRKSHLVCLGGRDLVRDLSVPVGPGERVSVIDALAGG
jgi:molybdopterin-guanine dinucleotide biosynthesis protein A